jgi:hypothetical protein
LDHLYRGIYYSLINKKTSLVHLLHLLPQKPRVLHFQHGSGEHGSTTHFSSSQKQLTFPEQVSSQTEQSSVALSSGTHHPSRHLQFGSVPIKLLSFPPPHDILAYFQAFTKWKATRPMRLGETGIPVYARNYPMFHRNASTCIVACVQDWGC